MKIAMGILLASTFIFASSGFDQNKKYTCLNTIIIENGVKQEVDMTKSIERPFIFTIKGKKLTTVNNEVFDFKMEKEDMSSYSNDSYMLLLMKNKELGIVPKKTRGQVQYFFKCKN